VIYDCGLTIWGMIRTNRRKGWCVIEVGDFANMGYSVPGQKRKHSTNSTYAYMGSYFNSSIVDGCFGAFGRLVRQTGPQQKRGFGGGK
jgi:hypothetical protein